MKHSLISVVAAGFFSLNSHATSLLDHIAFASHDITAECSDYLGKVSAGGNVVLRDFLIQDQRGLAGCALSAGGQLNFYSGTVEKQGRHSCVASKKSMLQNVAYSNSARSNLNFAALTNEMQTKVSEIERLPGARIVSLDTRDYPNTGTIVLEGSAHEILIVRSREMNPVINGVGVELVGGVGPDNIVWDFGRAQTLRMSFSGNPSLGMPGTFIAPFAEVTFQNILITGALYARSISGRADRQDCTGRVSGQINPAPLRIPHGKPPYGGGRSW